MTMPGRSFNAGNSYRYGFNGQEKSDEIFEGSTTALFWEYDSRIGRRWNLDPKPNKWESQYSVMGGNSMWNSDIKGDSYIINKTKDSKTGKLKKVEVSATIYIRGKGVDKAKEEELNKQAKDIFKSSKVNGVEVSFNINYVYNTSINGKDLKAGENILDFSEKAGRSEIESKRKKLPDGTIQVIAGSFGTIYQREKNDSRPLNQAVFHETGHLVGLPDRYEDLEYPGSDLGNAENVNNHPGFSGDLMQNGKKLSQFYYEQYFKKANEYKSNTIHCFLSISYNKNGVLLTDPKFEKDGIHKPHPFKKD